MHSLPSIDLAPIQGVTNELYRNLFHRSFAGVDRYFAPFVKIRRQARSALRQKAARLPDYDPAKPLVPQILSKEAEEFLILDQALHDSGYPVLNWNLGCPAPMATAKQLGCGLLPFPARVQAILEQVGPKLRCRLSIKTRLGLNRPDELLALIPIFNQFPIEELIIHPRLGRQLYRGQVDLNAFEDCLRTSRHPVTYNGDIFNTRTFDALQKRFPHVRRWMLGRGILVDPFLPARIKGRTERAQDEADRLMRFHDEYAARYGAILSGPAHLLDKLKEYWSYHHLLFVGGRIFYQRLLRVKRYEEYVLEIGRFFSQGPEIADPIALTSEDFR